MISDIERRTVELIEAFRERLDDHWLDSFKCLAEHNECEVALECLCSQLDEFDIIPSSEEYDEIRKIAAIMRIKESYWISLDPKKSSEE
jgi:hypothetical protein